MDISTSRRPRIGIALSGWPLRRMVLLLCVTPMERCLCRLKRLLEVTNELLGPTTHCLDVCVSIAASIGQL